jgi:hypothetical protein
MRRIALAPLISSGVSSGGGFTPPSRMKKNMALNDY